MNNQRHQPLIFAATVRAALVVGGLCASLSMVFGDSLAATKNQTPGISDTKPADGPAVMLDGKFMVPYTQTIPGTDLTIEMIPIPGGTYTMGSPEDEEGREDDEGPQIEVTVQPMWVAKNEISWVQYKEYMGLYSIFKEFEGRGERTVDPEKMVDAITAPTPLYSPDHTFEYGEEPEQAAVSMTQYAAQQFTKWLSRITGNQYRLPTEAEWEYVARAGTKTAFSFGDDSDGLEDYAWYYDNSDEGQSPVGTKKPNPWGLHDMHGNVAEWTVNQYTDDGYQSFKDSGITNATEMVQWPETQDNCVVRGGSWEGDPENLRSAARLASDDEGWKEEDPNYPKSPWWFTSDPARGVGFRLFRSAKDLPTDKITKFWEPGPEDLQEDIQARLDGGRGGLGQVDPSLPEAMKEFR